MRSEIKHRRLHAFYKSKVLNMLMILIFICLFAIGYSHSLFLPTLCGSFAFMLFCGYSLWLWIKKPQQVTTNELLSDTNGLFTLYFIVVTAANLTNEWWYISAFIAAMAALFLSFLNFKDQEFEI